MTSKTQSQNHFSIVPNAEIQRSKFDRSCGVKTTFDTGQIVPIMIDEALPGDTIDLDISTFGRLATPIFPFMDNLDLDIHVFFVPNRLVWDNWEKFNGAQDNPGDSTTFTMPQMQAPASTGYASLSIYDHFGLPTKIPNYSHTSLPLRGYNLIWNTWYRDENLQNSVTVRKTDSGDVTGDFNILYRGMRKDYFMSCLPSPQKGPAVSLPLGTSAPIAVSGFTGANAINPTVKADTAPNVGQGYMLKTTTTYLETPGPASNANPMYADLSAATAATINQLRLAFQIQRMYERDARGGTRYIEIIKAHFNVTVPDFRLQRPEFLGSLSSRITATPIAKTSSTDATAPQGNLAAFCTTSGNGRVKHSFVEHGYIYVLASVRGTQSYQQGLNRLWSRLTRFDFYWPTLAHLGEQAVLNKEIYMQDPSTATPAGVNEAVFGYQERYAEYRFKPNEIHGAFRSNYTGTLDPWHLAFNFASLPALGGTLISTPVQTQRLLAVPSQPHVLLDAHFEYWHSRPMPTYSVPGLIDHF